MSDQLVSLFGDEAVRAAAGVMGAAIASETVRRIELSKLSVYLGRRIAHLLGLQAGHMESAVPIVAEPEGIVPVAVLREKLREAPILDKPRQVTVEGTFFPAVLLYSGWWEREHRDRVRRPKWHDDLQAWLFNGFEQWGPSWDFNVAQGAGDGSFFGQIGDGDEANSLLVTIPREKTGRVCEALGGGAKAVEVKATGWLCHRQHLDLGYRHLSEEQRWAIAAMGRQIAWGKNFDYCLVISAEERLHKIVPQRRRQPESYSGYLWECWAPQQWLETTNPNEIASKPPPLNKIYFLWEHTDFTKRDAVSYNLDSLYHKVAYLEKQHGGLVLLQKSSDLVPGTPILRKEVFYAYVMQ